MDLLVSHGSIIISSPWKQCSLWDLGHLDFRIAGPQICEKSKSEKSKPPRFTSVAVMLTNVFNGLLVGLVFSKFSSSTARKWALVFSPTLCGAVIKEFDSSASGGGGGSSSSSLAAEEPKHRRKKVISLKVIKSTILKRHYQNTYSSIGGFHRLTPSYLDYYSPRIQSSSNLETFLNLNTGYSISFRLMNVTQSLFFSPVLSIFLLEHGTQDLIISQISLYHTDVPLQFLELPITITVINHLNKSFPGRQ